MEFVSVSCVVRGALFFWGAKENLLKKKKTSQTIKSRNKSWDFFLLFHGKKSFFCSEMGLWIVWEWKGRKVNVFWAEDRRWSIKKSRLLDSQIYHKELFDPWWFSFNQDNFCPIYYKKISKEKKRRAQQKTSSRHT